MLKLSQLGQRGLAIAVAGAIAAGALVGCGDNKPKQRPTPDGGGDVGMICSGSFVSPVNDAMLTAADDLNKSCSGSLHTNVSLATSADDGTIVDLYVGTTKVDSQPGQRRRGALHERAAAPGRRHAEGGVQRHLHYHRDGDRQLQPADVHDHRAAAQRHAPGSERRAGHQRRRSGQRRRARPTRSSSTCRPTSRTARRFSSRSRRWAAPPTPSSRGRRWVAR